MTLAALLEEVRQAPAEKLPGIRAVLVEAESVVLMRMMLSAVEGERSYTTEQAAKRLDLPVWRVRELIRKGDLASVKHGKRGQRVSGAALEEFTRRGGVR